MSEQSQVLSRREESKVHVIHTLDKSRSEFKQDMFTYLYGGGPEPTIDYRTIGRRIVGELRLSWYEEGKPELATKMVLHLDDYREDAGGIVLEGTSLALGRELHKLFDARQKETSGE